MATAHESRRACLVMLLEKWKAEDKGSQRAFADYCNINPGYISQMALGGRDIGSASARRIEKAFMLEQGYMDTYLSGDSDPIADEAATIMRQLNDRQKGIEYLRSLLKAQLLESEITHEDD